MHAVLVPLIVEKCGVWDAEAGKKQSSSLPPIRSNALVTWFGLSIYEDIGF